MIGKEDLHRATLAGCSAVFAGFWVHPVDTTKIKMQIQERGKGAKPKYKNLFQGARLIIMEEGIGRSGIMKGIEASALREASYSTLRLGLYEPIKRAMGATDPKTTPVWKKYLSGALSGLTGSGIVNPADLLKTRMQGEPPGVHHTLTWHAKDVYRTTGLIGFYRGVLPTMARATFVGATYMGTYDTTKYFIINHGYLKDGFLCQFASSIVTGLALTLTSSPVDNIKTRIMNQRVSSSGEAITKQYSSMLDCAIKMYKYEGGFASFYRGFGAQWGRFSPYAIIQLLAWEFLRKISGFQAI